MRDLLLSEARKVALRAYAPYSKFRVGAAVLVKDAAGIAQLVTGVNVENASLGLSICAERNALATACASYGTPGGLASSSCAEKPVITHVAIACIDVPADAPIEQRTPCGACRQWFAELAPQALFYIDGIEQALTLHDLFPLAFRLGPV